MKPEEAIADLDASLLVDGGESVRLQRLTLGPGGTQVPFEVELLAFIRGYAPNELANGITQQDVKVICSPTAIERAGWPGPAITRQGETPATEDRRIPRRGDRVITARGLLAVQAATGLMLGGELVRIEIQARG